MAKKLTDKEKRQRKIKRQADEFMKTVDEFLKKKNNGSVPTEWGCCLMLLRTYYEQFIALTLAINDLDDLVFTGRYGPQPSPLLTARDKASLRLESLMSELGLTMKAASKLDIIEPVSEESPLDKYAKSKIEKR